MALDGLARVVRVHWSAVLVKLLRQIRRVVNLVQHRMNILHQVWNVYNVDPVMASMQHTLHVLRVPHKREYRQMVLLARRVLETFKRMQTGPGAVCVLRVTLVLRRIVTLNVEEENNPTQIEHSAIVVVADTYHLTV